MIQEYDYNITPLTGIRPIIAKNREAYKAIHLPPSSLIPVFRPLSDEDQGRTLYQYP